MSAVLISYCKLNEEHHQKVVALARWLASKGIAYILDDEHQNTHNQPWYIWAARYIEQCSVVLMVFDAEYAEAWRATERRGAFGAGAEAETKIIQNHLSNDVHLLGKKFKVVLFKGFDTELLPPEVKGSHWYAVDFASPAEDLIESIRNTQAEAPAETTATTASTASSTPSWIKKAEPAKNDHPHRVYVEEIEQAIKKLRRETRDEALRVAEGRIMNVMGALTERFGATSSWLFLRELTDPATPVYIEEGSFLKSRSSHNGGPQTFRLPAGISGGGIVGHVAVTRRPYLTNDVNSDEDKWLYEKLIPETKSELAVPVLMTDDDGREHVVGVLNLESKLASTFLEAHRGELMAAATRLAPDILVLQHFEQNKQAFGWHHEAHGWTLERLLEMFCSTVSIRRGETGGNDATLGRPSCTIWYRDEEQQCLYVRATARFDYEYLARRVLPLKSFTGIVSGQPRGSVGHGSPNNELKNVFQRPEKSKEMGLAYAFAAPVHLPGGDSGAVGTVNLYLFDEELPNHLKNSPDAIAREFPSSITDWLADQVGELIRDFRAIRDQAALAYLRYRLNEQALPELTEFDIVKDVILECLGAHMCSIFCREPAAAEGRNGPSAASLPQKGMLRCVATSGLTRFDGTPVEACEAFYDLDGPEEEQGITGYLAKQPNQNLRRNSVASLATGGKRTNDEPIPVNKYRESYSHAETEHRPFLGISVDSPKRQQKSNASEPVAPAGVIRVLRRSGSKPFVHADEELLRRLARHAYFLFQRSATAPRYDETTRSVVRGAGYSFVLRVFGDALTRPRLDAVDRLGTPFAAYGIWNRRHVDAVLLDLLNTFRNPRWRTEGKQGGLIASVRMKPTSPKNDAPRSLRLVAIQSLVSSDPPSESQLHAHESEPDSIGLQAISQGSPITFDRTCPLFRKIAEMSEDVVSGICMPFRVVTCDGVVDAVLSLDSDDMQLTDWREEHVQLVALAAKKLDFIGHDNSFQDPVSYRCRTWRETVKLFLQDALPKIGVEQARLFDAKSPLFGDWSREEKNQFETKFKPRKTKIENLSLSAAGAFEMSPCWWGAFETKLRLEGWLRADGPKAVEKEVQAAAMASKIAQISHCWNRFISSRIAMGAESLITFDVHPNPAGKEICDQGFQLWKFELRLNPNAS